MLAKPQPTLSLCMIVRNEERFIRQCLSSVKDYIHDIVVVDTGSEDSTVEIARQFGARIYNHPWNGNFAEARNHYLDYATGDWILSLDADEVLAIRDAQQLQTLISATQAYGFKLIQRTYLWNANYVCASPNPKTYEEGREYSDCVNVDVIRLFRNDSRIRYRGRVHELVEPAFLTNRLPYENTSLVIHHFGKVGDPARLENKKQLYLDLGRKKAEDDCNDPMAQFELGVQLYELESYAQCIPYFEASRKLNPAFDMALLYLAKACHRCGKTEEAKRYFKKCLKHGPENDKVLFEYANFVRDQGHLRAATKFYQKALRINPQQPLALFNMGAIYVQRGDIDYGLSSIKAAIRLNPDNVSFYENLGRLQLTETGLESAAQLLEDYLKRFPAAVGCRSGLAGIYFKLRQFEKALETADVALKIEPTAFSGILARANAQFGLGRLAEAEKSYRSALQQNPDHLDSMMNLAAIAEHNSDYNQAQSWYLRVLQSHPDQPQALKRYVVIQAKHELDSDASNILERAYNANPDDLQCLLLAGGLLERSGKFDRAAALYRSAGRLKPKWNVIVGQKVQRLETTKAT
jgi:tetratricopeptide (TPR) repeat protein